MKERFIVDLASSYPCLLSGFEIFMRSIIKNKKHKMKRVRTVFGDTSDRKMALIDVERVRVTEKKYGRAYEYAGTLGALWADCVTGTLYDHNGRCLSSDQIWIEQFIAHQSGVMQDVEK